MQLEVAVHGTEDFEGSELPSGYCHDECPLLYSCPSNTKMSPNVSCGLCMTMLCQCWSPLVTTVPQQWRMLMMKKAIIVLGKMV